MYKEDRLEIIDDLEETEDDFSGVSVLCEAGIFHVQCGNGCGIFTLEDVRVLGADVSSGTIRFRCPACNDIQVRELLILD